MTNLATAVSGSNAADFVITSPCSITTLAPNQGCTLTISFTPSGLGMRTASLAITSSDPNSPLIVPLSGTGVAAGGGFTITAANATATVASGSPANYLVTITPTGGFTGSIALTCSPLTAGPYATCSLLPPTLTLGGAQSAAVTINTITTQSSHIPGKFALLMLPLSLLFLRKQRAIQRSMLLLAICCAGLWLAGCGGSSSKNASNVRTTPPGTYQYQVTASSTTGTPSSQSVTLTLIVQ